MELTTTDVSVMVNAETDEGTYSFRCPLCESVVVKECPTHTVDLLVSAGVAFSLVDAVHEVVPHPGAPALTHDDLLEFHSFLGNDDLVAGALEGLLG
ncbi:MAG: hypothetical protein ACXIVQ_13275 [Acidimicrobiales bacterium]